MDRILNPVAAIYYSIFYTVCMLLHVLMFFLILKRTSSSLSTMRWLLYPSTLNNFLIANTTFFLQSRTVNNKQSSAILCQGPCKYLGPAACFHGYVLLMTLVSLNAVINMHMLYYRMASVKYFEDLNRRTLVFGLWYIIPVYVWIFGYIPPIDLEFVYQETLATYPDYDFEPYLKFGGFANSHHICMTLGTLSLIFLTSIAPFGGFFWRRETLKILNGNFTALSKHTIVQFKALIQGLSLQCLIPLVCYVPVGVSYIYNKYSGSQIILSQYTLAVMITLPAAWDPIFLISFIVPYRTTVKSMFLCGRSRIDTLPSQHVSVHSRAPRLPFLRSYFARWRTALTAS